jgi:uncharacterized membrane protein YccF (DUF307 family)
MSLLLNILWLIFGGIFVSLGYIAGGIALCFTIIGIPWGVQCFKLAIFALFPFGQDTRMADRPASQDLINVILNIIWLIFGGIWVMLNHLFWGLVLCITIIGIPFGIQHFKMVKLALWPFGREIYSSNGDRLF